MQRLIEGHKRFLAEIFPARRSQFHLLAELQAPEWLFITCSDSRVVPDLFLGTAPETSSSRATPATWFPSPATMWTA